jgi:hypothetical protein
MKVDERWPRIRKTLYIGFAASTVLAFLISFVIWNFTQALVSLIAVLCLALGFWITEILIGLLTGVKKANPTAVALLFLGKLGWWAGLFFLSRSLRPEWEGAVALGLGAFLLSLLLAGVAHYGLPRVRDVEE